MEASVNSSNVRSLAQWRAKDSAHLIEYLNARIKVGDLGGLVVQSVDRNGRERIHVTGLYKEDPARSVGAAISRAVKLAAGPTDFEDSAL